MTLDSKDFKPKLSIVIPCFNESKNILIVLKRLNEIVTLSKYEIEVIVVDGASTDDTGQALEEMFLTLDSKKFKLILRATRGGYGSDIMHALSYANGDFLAWTHADLQTDPYDVIRAYEFSLSFYESNKFIFVKGQRKNRRLTEVFFTFGMQIIVLLVLKKYLSDINAQPKLFSRKFYEELLVNNYPSDFSLDLFAMYQAKNNGYNIKTIPVFFEKRLHGEAKGGGGSLKNRLKLISRTFKYIFELKNKITN